MLICDLLRNQNIVSAEAHQTVLEVASMMVEHNIGAVPVLQNGQLAGIFSERDLMSRVVVSGKDPAHTPVDCCRKATCPANGVEPVLDEGSKKPV